MSGSKDSIDPAQIDEISAYFAFTSTWKIPNEPADYPLRINVIASNRQIQLIYRGNDCTGSTHGEINGTTYGRIETDTITARTYTTCDPKLR